MITPEGVGPLTIGSDAAASMMLTFFPGYCREFNPTYPPGEDAGRWIADYTSSDGVLPFTVEVDAAGSVTNIDITTAELATAEGIRIGSTLEELRATYPDLVDDAANPASSTHLLRTPTSILLFEAVTAESSSPELAGQIALIRIVEPGSPFLGEAFATDSLIGGCL